METEDNLIASKFEEWTKGKDPKEARISVFEHIRDIPYAIVPSLRDPAAGPSGLLKLCKGSCVPKHFLLGTMFGMLGISVKYATYTFSWDDPGVKYPPDLRALVKKMPITGHLACKALIDGRWVLVDATWDRPLAKAGFPVNERWDGVSDTANAVKYIKETVHESLEERIEYDGAVRGAFTAGEKAAYGEFIRRLNPWLDKIRGR
ncbi:MAG: hypothetical protein WC515_04555 [Candidatus Omnitrophota bacterium]